MESAGLELGGKPLAERALAAAARSGDQHELNRVLPVGMPFLDLLGDTDDLLFLEGFCDPDQV